MSISRRHLLAKLGIALPAAALVAASAAEAETTSGSHRKRHTKAASRKSGKPTAHNGRHAPTAG